MDLLANKEYKILELIDKQTLKCLHRLKSSLVFQIKTKLFLLETRCIILQKVQEQYNKKLYDHT